MANHPQPPDRPPGSAFWSSTQRLHRSQVPSRLCTHSLWAHYHSHPQVLIVWILIRCFFLTDSNIQDNDGGNESDYCNNHNRDDKKSGKKIAGLTWWQPVRRLSIERAPLPRNLERSNIKIDVATNIDTYPAPTFTKTSTTWPKHSHWRRHRYQHQQRTMLLELFCLWS